MTDSERALAILTEARNKLEPLWDYCPGRPLGWVDLILSGVLEELAWKVNGPSS